jgi:isoquinoline 1-oxidoreductase
MKNQYDHYDIEEGRFEMDEEPNYHFKFNRRRFLKFFSGGLAVAVVFGSTAHRYSDLVQLNSNKLPIDQVGAWLHISEEGKVIVFTGKVEFGQNIRTSLAQAVAEELRLPIESIEMVMGDTDRTPYDRGTFGSLSTPQMAPILRRAAVAAREMLLDQAAEKWKTNRKGLLVANGKVTDVGQKRSLTLGEITKGKQLIETIGEEDLTPASKWNICGTSVPKVNGRSFITGQHKYTSDMHLPGMLYGKVLRSPSFGSKLISADISRASNMPGVIVVQDGNFIGVAAPNQSTATNALAAIRADWETTSQISQDELFEHLKKTSSRESGRRNRSPNIIGSVKEAMATAVFTNEQLYTAQYIAHAPLEPRAALAEWKDGKLTVWTGTQRPFGVHAELTQAFNLNEDRVRVLVPDTGSGYGGKHTGETAIEAARLAKTAGKPVKLVWTREEEFTWAYARPAARIEVKSGTNKEGKLTAWEFHTYNAGGSAIDTYYEVSNRHIQSHSSDSPLRQGSYRALAATVNHFARESHMDELAHQVGLDPLDFRLKNLQDERMIAVLSAAAEKFGWKESTSSSGRGFGLACGYAKNGYLATFAEVAIDRGSGNVRVVRVVAAFDCGAVVNPIHLKGQIEGCIIQGLGGALFESIEFGNGRIHNPFFSNYRVPRFRDIPELDIILMNRTDLPSVGAGEAPIVGIAPAIGNAIFAATGKRLRSMPLVPNGLEF